MQQMEAEFARLASQGFTTQLSSLDDERADCLETEFHDEEWDRMAALDSDSDSETEGDPSRAYVKWARETSDYEGGSEERAAHSAQSFVGE